MGVLVIGGCDNEDDTLTVETRGVEAVEFETRTDDNGFVALSRDEVRELFNYLGIWLHKAAPADEED